MALYHNHYGLVLCGESILSSGISIDEMHEKEVPHLHGGIILLRRNYREEISEVLVQKRAETKKQYPGHFCLSAGGHCMEEDLERDPLYPDLSSIVRETSEEIGVIINLEVLIGHAENALSLKSEIELQDKRYHTVKGQIVGLKRFDTSLNIQYEPAVHPYNEKMIFTVVYIALPYDVNLDFQLARDELADLSWENLGKMRNSACSTPWLHHFLNTMPSIL